MHKNVITVWEQDDCSNNTQERPSTMEDSQYLGLSSCCCPSSSASTSTAASSALPSPVEELTEFDLTTRNSGSGRTSSRASPDTSIDGDNDDPLPVSSIILGGGVFVSLVDNATRSRPGRPRFIHIPTSTSTGSPIQPSRVSAVRQTC